MRRRSIGRTSELGTVPNNAFVGGFSANVGIGETVTISHSVCWTEELEDEKVAAALMERFGYWANASVRYEIRFRPCS